MDSTFPAIEFHQFNDGADDRLIIFAAPATSISAWAGIPRKSWKLRALYQRWITPSRESEVTEFWNRAADYDAFGTKYLMGPTALTLASPQDILLTDGKISLHYENPIHGLTEDLDKLDTIAPLALDLFLPRLTPAQQELVAEVREGYEADFEMDCVVFETTVQIAQIVNDSNRFKDENEISEEELRELIEGLEAITRPALVVDGQHRLWGAATASAGSDIWLPVVLMPSASWVDQIYQFVIINETAKKVDTSLLTDIFGNSLTEEEAVQARKRFESSNIDVEARIAAVLADSHADSPFNGMVKWRGVGGSGTTATSNGFLNEKTIRDLIQGQGRGRGFRVDDEFYTCVVEPTIPNRDDWMNWTDGRWKDFWFAFWSEVRDYYNSEAPAGKTLWSNTVQSNLTKAVTLRQFQRLYMTQAIEKVNKAKDSRATFEDAGVPEEQVEEYVGAALQKVVLPESVEDFRESVREWFLSLGVPVRVFVYDWVSSLDDAQGQDALWDELNKAYRCIQRGDRYRAEGGIFKKNDDG